MTPRARMLAAYRGEPADTLPVAPEFWYYLPARLLGVDMVTFEREVPHWQALQQTFRHYGIEGWGVVGPAVPTPGVRRREEWVEVGGDRFESRVTTETPHGALHHRQLFDRLEPSWPLERPVKDFTRDWPAWRAATLGLVEEADWSGVRAALAAVGEDYLLEVMVGVPFFDYLAGGREGGLQQGIFDLLEHEAECRRLHEEYTDHLCRLAGAACEQTAAAALFLGCSWSCVSLLGPHLWRRWDKPVIRAVADAVHRHGRLLHVHFHGRCREVLADLADCGADCVCPFERPPGGDITDLGEVRRLLGGRVTVNGNVHTVETLIRGTPADVRREVEQILEQWGPDRRRLILGTGDQVGRETPEENLRAMIEAGRSA